MFTMFGGEGSLIPDTYDKLFGMGTEPVDDAAAYPSKAELLDTLNSTRDSLLELLNTVDAERLAQPVPEEMKEFVSSWTVLVATMAWHEGIHTGQLIDLRYHLDLPRVYG